MGANSDLESAARHIEATIGDAEHSNVTNCPELCPMGVSGQIRELWRPLMVQTGVSVGTEPLRFSLGLSFCLSPLPRPPPPHTHTHT